MHLADKYNIFVVEDAAQAVDSFFLPKGNPKQAPQALGSIGHLGCFSFHETKNIQSGEGGLLAINDERFIKRSEILWEKGTNRAEFFRGEVNKYGWVDTGSSFLPSEITAAFLWAQLEEVDKIQKRRKDIWTQYSTHLQDWADKQGVKLPFLPTYATQNAHMFYLVCPNPEFRTALISYLRQHKIHSVFHYLSLHSSPYYHAKHDGRSLPHSDHYTDCLLRLPFFYELTEIEKICKVISDFKL